MRVICPWISDRGQSSVWVLGLVFDLHRGRREQYLNTESRSRWSTARRTQISYCSRTPRLNRHGRINNSSTFVPPLQYNIIMISALAVTAVHRLQWSARIPMIADVIVHNISTNTTRLPATDRKANIYNTVKPHGRETIRHRPVVRPRRKICQSLSACLYRILVISYIKTPR